MEFSLWWKSFTVGRFSSCFSVGRTKWSSEKNKEFFVKLSEKLVDHRDAGDIVGFNKLCTLVETHPQFKGRNAELVVTAGRVTIAYKRGDADLAKSFLKEFENLLKISRDNLIFEIRLRLSQSLVARSEKKYEECYMKSIEGLQLGQNIPPGLCLLWLYLECAMNAALLGSQSQGDVEVYQSLKKEALVYLEGAASVANTLSEDNVEYRICDFRHKLCIYKAWVLLNFSVTGEVATIPPSKEDLNSAKAEIDCVSNNSLTPNTLTKFREIEFILVKCDFSKRLSEIQDDETNKTKMLEDALLEAEKAKVLAKAQTKNNFQKLFEYAEYRCEVLQHNIKELSSQRTFEGYEY